jgi:hypothetical protein
MDGSTELFLRSRHSNRPSDQHRPRVQFDRRDLEPSVNRLVFGMATSALFLGWRLLREIGKSGRLDRRN